MAAALTKTEIRTDERTAAAVGSVFICECVYKYWQICVAGLSGVDEFSSVAEIFRNLYV